MKTAAGIKLSEVIEMLDSEDTFLCSKHGYCIEKFYKYSATNELIPISNIEYNERSIKIDR